MDLPDEGISINILRTHLLEKGYLASANIANDLKLPEQTFKNLSSYVEQISRNKESLNKIPGNLDEQSSVIRRLYRLMDSTFQANCTEERIVDLENLVLHFKNILPSSVILLAEIPSKKYAGYLIDQKFVADWKVILHKSPVLEKKGRASRRYKVILRIKRLEKSSLKECALTKKSMRPKILRQRKGVKSCGIPTKFGILMPFSLIIKLLCSPVHSSSYRPLFAVSAK